VVGFHVLTLLSDESVAKVWGAAFDCDLKSEQMGGVHSKGESSDAATQNPNGYTSS
jgi:hypothetical protein